MNGQVLAYDGRGNLTGDGTWTYGYDGLDRLASARKAGVEAAYGYLPTGERAWKRVNGADTLYLTAGGQGLAELSADGTLLRAFLPGPGGLAPAAVWEGGQWRYPLTDRRGSVLLVTDGGSTVLGRARFDAWGRGTPAPGSPFGFTGHRFDSETGLYATPTRHHSPVLGRWLQLDPIGIKDGLNRYAYVKNDPLGHVDPDGRFAHLLIGAVIGATVEIGVQVYNGAGSIDQINFREVAGSALIGAVGGGASQLGAAIVTRGFGLPALNKFAGRVLGTESRAAVISSKEAIQAFSSQAGQAGFKSAGEVGKVIGWGGGRNAAAQATERTSQITKDVVAGMRDQGLTKELATAARDVYRSAVAEGTGGATAEARLKLMERILKNW